MNANKQHNYIKIEGFDGILFVDDGSNEIEVDKNGYLVTKRFKKPYKLFFRVTKQIQGKRYNRKKTLNFKPSTSIRTACRIALEQRIETLKRIGTDKDRQKIDKQLKEQPTLNEAFEFMLATRKLKEKTAKDYELFYNKHLRHTIGYKRIGDIDSYEVQRIADNMKIKGYKPRTIFKIVEILNPLFKYYKMMRVIKENPIDYVQKERNFNNEMEITLTDDEKRELIKAIRSYPIEPFRGIFIFLATGRRLNEVLSLEWKHINIEEGFFTIPKENSKSGKELIFPLTQDLLEALPEEQRGRYVFGAIKEPDKKMHQGTVRRHWKRVLETAGIKRLRMHDLRHMIGNTMISEGYTLEQIATILGHSSISVTKRYAKAELNSKKELMEGLKRLFE